jgi:GGDEF domain-containing protein
MVVGNDELERVGGEEFLAVVDSVNRWLTEDVMVDLNTAVTEGQDEAEVAEQSSTPPV